jgi:pyruvate/2-oxoglutarate dehydrogenase complex dihydrolipoamide acyltransferase (E2) component
MYVCSFQLGDGSKNVPVGKVIAMLAEEGDDISNIEAPKDESAPAPKQESAPSPPSGSASSSAPPKADASKPSGEHAHGTPTHSRPLFPSVLRLLQEAGVSDAAQIKGTGMRGMLTKGDVLAFLGRASGPLGTYKPPKPDTAAPKATGAGGAPSKPAKVTHP